MSQQATALRAVVTRYSFFRFSTETLARALVLMGVAFLLVSVAAVVLAFRQPRDRIVSATCDGRILVLPTLDQPYVTNAQLLDFASRAAEESMTFGFSDYQLRQEQIRGYFTNEGFAGFLNGLKDGRVVEAIKKSFVNITAVKRGAPTITQMGLNQAGSVFEWWVQIPMTYTYDVGQRQQSRQLTLTLKIVRVSHLERSPPIGIAQWVESQARSS